MAKRTKYEFGKTYYSIAEVELTEVEGQWLEGKRAKGKWVNEYQFDTWLSGEEGQRYRDAIEHHQSLIPGGLNARERTILNLAKKIGYIEAMAERKLWLNMQQAINSPKGTAKRAKNADEHQRAVALQYQSFRDQGMTCIEARKAIVKYRRKKNKKPRYDPSSLLRIFKEQGII